MRRPVIKLAAGALLLLAGALLVVGPPLYKNALTATIGGMFDLTDRACRKASVAKGGDCPAGCVARPPRAPSERYGTPQCRSRLWVGLCGKECEPFEGFARLKDGSLVSSTTLLVETDGPGREATLAEAVKSIGAELDPGISGLNRYRVVIEGGNRRALERARRRLLEMPGIIKVEYEVK